MVEISDTAEKIVGDLSSIVNGYNDSLTFFLVKSYFLGNENEVIRQLNNQESIARLKEQVLYGLATERARREIIESYIEKTAGFEPYNID